LPACARMLLNGLNPVSRRSWPCYSRTTPWPCTSRIMPSKFALRRMKILEVVSFVLAYALQTYLAYNYEITISCCPLFMTCKNEVSNLRPERFPITISSRNEALSNGSFEIALPCFTLVSLPDQNDKMRFFQFNQCDCHFCE